MTMGERIKQLRSANGFTQEMKKEKMNDKSQIKYIPGIDGLRAIAVLMVLAYHLRIPIAKGGILGVTIFCLVWNHQENGGLIWIASVGLFVTAAVAGLCWQRRRDLKKEIG